MIDPATATVLLNGTKLLERPLESLVRAASGPLKTLISKWNASGARDGIVQKISDIELVRTIFSPIPVALSSFYYPSRVQSASGGKPTAIKCIDDISSAENVLLLGTVGQGKSILMRYLCVQEIKQGKRIPVFLELREIEVGATVKSELLKAIEHMSGSQLTDTDMDFFLESGTFLILLDGFDEIKRELAISIQSELSRLMKKFEKTRWIISSRPGSLSGHIAGLPKLKVFEVSPLSITDFDPFLSALAVSPDSRKKLIAAIESSTTEIKSVLKTPLMLTLLNLTFGTSTHIPDTLHEFYESMFLFLVFRHDETKPGFTRAKVTQLSNADLQEVFEHFSFLSKTYGVSLTDEEFSLCVRDTAKLTNREFTPEGLRADFTETVCLMMRDGLRTAFIHRSIQEFFAAFFLKHLGEEGPVKEIYASLDSNKYLGWQQELRFLEQIDKYRYIQFYRLPSIEKFLKDCDYSTSSRVGVSKVKFLKYLAAQPIYTVEVPRHAKRDVDLINVVLPDKSFGVFTHAMNEVLGLDGMLPLGFTMEELLPEGGKVSKFSTHLRKDPPQLERLLGKFRDFSRRVEREKAKLTKVLEMRQDAFRSVLMSNR